MGSGGGFVFEFDGSVDPMSRAPVGWPGNAAHGGTKSPSM